MTPIRTHTWTRRLSALMVITIVATLYPVTLLSADPEDTPTKVLLFPLADMSGSQMAGLARLAEGALQLAVSANPGMEATEFSGTSALVRRALSEGRILPIEAEARSFDARQAIKIGRSLMMDWVLLAQLDAVRVGGDPHGAEVVLSGRLYDVAANFDAATMQPVENPVVGRAFNVVGSYRAPAGYQGSDRVLVRGAIEDAASKAAQVLAGKSLTEIEAAAPAPKARSGWRSSGYLLGLGLLVALIASSGGGEPGPSADAAPPTPIRLDVEPNAIRLRWMPPTATTLTLLRYQIQRSVDGGPWQFIDAGTARADLTEWPDFDVVVGHAYRYQIRALYTNSEFSEWRVFSAVNFGSL